MLCYDDCAASETNYRFAVNDCDDCRSVSFTPLSRRLHSLVPGTATPTPSTPNTTYLPASSTSAPAAATATACASRGPTSASVSLDSTVRSAPNPTLALILTLTATPTIASASPDSPVPGSRGESAESGVALGRVAVTEMSLQTGWVLAVVHWQARNARSASADTSPRRAALAPGGPAAPASATAKAGATGARRAAASATATRRSRAPMALSPQRGPAPPGSATLERRRLRRPRQRYVPMLEAFLIQKHCAALNSRSASDAHLLRPCPAPITCSGERQTCKNDAHSSLMLCGLAGSKHGPAEVPGLAGKMRGVRGGEVRGCSSLCFAYCFLTRRSFAPLSQRQVKGASLWTVVAGSLPRRYLNPSSTTCVDCAPGTVCPQGSSAQKQCLRCQPGSGEVDAGSCEKTGARDRVCAICEAGR